jgi:hypothetical protein
MKLYKVEPKPRLSESADGRFTWSLPVVRCEECDALVGTHIGYPNLDISGTLDGKRYELPSPVSWSQFEDLKGPLAEIAGRKSPLFPGVRFGPFRGTVKHTEKRDFVWVWLQELLPRESAWERLTQMGLKFPTGPAIMRDRKTQEIRKDYQRIVEVPLVSCVDPQSFEKTNEEESRQRAEFGARLGVPAQFIQSDDKEPRSCSKCRLAMGEGRRLGELILTRASIPQGTLLFVPQEVPGFIIASEEFAQAVRQARLTNISFEPVHLT